MTVCTYDNPTNMTRECWRDGKLICAYNWQLLRPFTEQDVPAKYFFLGANVGPWNSGQLIGDEAALPPNPK